MPFEVVRPWLSPRLSQWAARVCAIQVDLTTRAQEQGKSEAVSVLRGANRQCHSITSISASGFG